MHGTQGGSFSQRKKGQGSALDCHAGGVLRTTGPLPQTPIALRDFSEHCRRSD
jgi:hypothetical protein